MRIAVIGLGYVGTVSVACLAHWGHQVIASDADPERLAALKRGKTHVHEPGLSKAGLTALLERIATCEDAAEAVAQCDLVLVCVGTPTRLVGSPDVRSIHQVAADIGRGIRDRQRAGALTVVLRSTVPPGTTEGAFRQGIVNASGKAPGRTWELLFVPEFLREGHALEDFSVPEITVLGLTSGATGKAFYEAFEGHTGRILHCVSGEAELLKWACNSFHAVKVAFANEVGSLAASLGLDGRAVMGMLAQDRLLNASSAYLLPGPPFGGSCLPKDLRAMLDTATARGMRLPMLGAVLPANQAHLERLLREIEGLPDVERVGIAGLSFKAGTNDLRESPWVELYETLTCARLLVQVFDPQVRRSNVVHVVYADSLDSLCQWADLLLVTKHWPGQERALARHCPPHVLDVSGDSRPLDHKRVRVWMASPEPQRQS